MAINKNHEFDDLDGIKCAVVEKNVSPERTEFLKNLLEHNGFTVVVIKSPLPKVAAKSAAALVADGVAAPAPTPEPELPTTNTIGVTDVTFNTTNAIFGRLLHTPDRHVVSLAYWNQQEKTNDDETPYYEKHF